MKIVKILFFLMVWCVALPSFGAMRIEDPQNILGQSDQFLGNVSFESAFRCGDKAAYENNECRLNCNENGCEEMCSPPVQSHTSVIACSADSVTLRSETPGEEPGGMIITREAYALFHGNWLRYLLEQQGEDNGKNFITIEKASLNDYRLQDGEIVKGMNIIFTVHGYDKDSKMYMHFSIAVTIGKDIPGVGQVLNVMALPELAKTPLMRLLSVERHQ